MEKKHCCLSYKMLKARRSEDRAFPVLHIPPPPPVTPPPTDLQTALRYYSQTNKQGHV